VPVRGSDGTGERVSISTSHAAVEGYESVPEPGPVSVARPETAMFRRRSLQPSRRAVLHLQAAGDPAVPSGLGDWFTERAFHFYLAGLRLPKLTLPRFGRGRAGGGSVYPDLDSACAYLRETDGIGHVIVTAQGRAALAAALWSDARGNVSGNGADALILSEPALPARPAIRLNIACPVLVLTGRTAAASARLGSHVTWLQLAEPGGPAVYDELGRWLGAYMYGPGLDRLL
jgi:hypothetical protein